MNSHMNTDATAKSGGVKIKNDLRLIAILLLVIAVAALCLFLFRTEGNVVTILLDGEIYGEYPLDVDRRVEVRVGEAFNVIVIENGEVRVDEASCPDGICAAHRPVRFNGQSIICLPNDVVVEIRTNGENQPDIIV